MSDVSAADRARWLRRSAHALLSVLDAHPNLPAIAWTVTPVGISARVHVVTNAQSTLNDFTAWTTALGLRQRRHHSPTDPERRYLHARGAIDGTRITLTAVIDNSR
jgi:hypothetical protein